MVQIDDVKQISHDLVESHNARGFGLVKLTPTEPQSVGVLLNVTKEPLVVDGRELKAKVHVRKFLWELSKNAGLKRKDRSFVWSKYLEEEGKSVVGIATIVDRKVAELMALRDEGYQWIEVQP